MREIRNIQRRHGWKELIRSNIGYSAGMGIEASIQIFSRGTSAVTSSKSETRSTLYVFPVHRWRGGRLAAERAPFAREMAGSSLSQLYPLLICRGPA
jgi:hypothetical protein